MKNFYIVEDNKISIGTGIEIPTEAIEYIIGEEPVVLKNFLHEEKEKERLLSIKRQAQFLILEKYPLEKQSSAQLGLYGEVYLQEMKDYISNMIRISNEAELNGTKVEDIQWL